MEKANFHTTIAFIPWNYERSEDEVVTLFREHPDRFSVSVHGNNHDHYEFYKYKTNLRDLWPAKPLRVQEENIVQAVARMERFRGLTGIDYDRVMVFPHTIAPVKTLWLLKKYGFLSTVNAGNVPLDAELPYEFGSKSHFEPLLFDNFVSLNRWSANNVSRDGIAYAIAQSKPLLFYVHHEFFENGIDAFNSIAEMVNSMDPRVQWKSLGYISRHLYLQKKRDDSYYDVRSFSRCIELENRQKSDLTYFVRKEESFSPTIRHVTVDGKTYPYERSGYNLSLTITIPAGQSRTINMEYENALDVTSIDISKNDPHINKLRRLSDFRDITLSKNMLGRSVVDLYYKTGLYKLGLKRLIIVCLVLSSAMGVGGWYLLRYIRSYRLRLGRIKNTNGEMTCGQ